MRKKPPSASSGLRLCSVCLKYRQERFYGPDARRSDGLSTRCNNCRRGSTTLANRNQRIQDTYGISSAEYSVLLASQDGACAICKGKRSYNLDIDHCHALERAGKPARETVRGLLCKTCNRRLLRAAKDNVDVLQAAIDYLQGPPARGIL